MKRTLGEVASIGTTVVMVVCVLLVTGFTLRRESAARKPLTAFEKQSDWQSYASVGHRMGPANAKVVMVEFADFQCPACAGLAQRISDARKKFPDDFAVVFRHFPLNIHMEANDAAQASECAGGQGKFESMYTTLFAERDLVAKGAWTQLATQAGVPSAKAFETCMADSTSFRAVRADRQAGDRLGVRGTPTILINGWRYTGGLTPKTLDSLIQNALAGHK